MPKVLLVDDVELFLELERSYLAGCGYELITAASGEETLQRLDKVAPDLLLLDYHMPGINGDEVCRLIRINERWQHLPIIMVTAAGKVEEVKTCLEAGCDDYLTKPVNKQELQEKVERLLGQVKRRKDERIPVKMPVRVREGDRLHVASAHDLSTSGAYLKSSVPLGENDSIEIRFETSEGEPLILFGKIKRAAEKAQDGCGVYFHPSR